MGLGPGAGPRDCHERDRHGRAPGRRPPPLADQSARRTQHRLLVAFEAHATERGGPAVSGLAENTRVVFPHTCAGSRPHSSRSTGSSSKRGYAQARNAKERLSSPDAPTAGIFQATIRLLLRVMLLIERERRVHRHMYSDNPRRARDSGAGSAGTGVDVNYTLAPPATARTSQGSNVNVAYRSLISVPAESMQMRPRGIR